MRTSAWLVLAVAALMVVSVAAAPVAVLGDEGMEGEEADCENPSCLFDIVESVPEKLHMQTKLTTYESWMRMLRGAKKSIDFALFYMTLTLGDDDVEGWMGKNVYSEFYAAAKRGVRIRMAVSWPGTGSGYNNTLQLVKDGIAEVHFVNMTQLAGAGVLHTKFIVVDSEEFYVGSANADWRSLAQVKELGAYVRQCGCLARDLDKVFEMYVAASGMAQPPSSWPASMHTRFNRASPLHVQLNGTGADVYISSAPQFFAPQGREFDLTTIQAAMDEAEHTIDIEVMDYSPTSLYTEPRVYFGGIDDHIRAAALRGVHVRLLAGIWENTAPDMVMYLRSLDVLDHVDVALYKVPQLWKRIPFARVNHAKFMVTDREAFVGTSNWTQDYFINQTAGVSLSVRHHAPLREEVQGYFNRDWTSEYTTPVADYHA